ncbi:MAG TPA: hypothetical protein VG986_12445 [Pseudolabrys sp.]|nr:hypothetical protein [Pseudolabrys sp.]
MAFNLYTMAERFRAFGPADQAPLVVFVIGAALPTVIAGLDPAIHDEFQRARQYVGLSPT